MNRDPQKLRDWQQRSAMRAQERRKTKAAVKSMKRTKLRPVSAKRKAEAPARTRCLAAVRERCAGRCEYPGCHAAMQDGHERLARSQGGSPIDPANVIGLCRPHHEWVTTHMNQARALGLAK